MEVVASVPNEACLFVTKRCSTCCILKICTGTTLSIVKNQKKSSSDCEFCTYLIQYPTKNNDCESHHSALKTTLKLISYCIASNISKNNEL